MEFLASVLSQVDTPVPSLDTPINNTKRPREDRDEEDGEDEEVWCSILLIYAISSEKVVVFCSLLWHPCIALCLFQVQFQDRSGAPRASPSSAPRRSATEAQMMEIAMVEATMFCELGWLGRARSKLDLVECLACNRIVLSSRLDVHRLLCGGREGASEEHVHPIISGGDQGCRF